MDASRSLRRNAVKQWADSVRGQRRATLKSVRGHTGEAPLRKWPIACGLANGQSDNAIAKRLNRFFTTIWKNGLTLGFSGESAIYDFGHPFTAESAARLKRLSGLPMEQFAKQVRIPVGVAEGAVRARRKGQRLKPAVAAKILEWRNSVVRKLLADSANPQGGGLRCSGSRILKTFFPDVRKQYSLLRTAIRSARAYLRQAPNASADDFGEHLCDHAMLRTAGRSRNNVADFLPWAAQHRTSATFLGRHWNQFKASGDPGVLAFTILASEWGTTHHIVAGVLKQRTRAIPPSEIHHLLTMLDKRPGQGTISRRKKPGPEPYAIEEKAEFKIGKQIDEEVLPRFRLICADLHALPRRARTNLNRATELLKNKNYSRSELEAATRSPGDPLIAARWFVCITTKRQYNVVAKYHQTYRRAVSNPNQS